MNEIRIGLETVQKAVDVRAAITERYVTYNVLSKIVQVTATIEHGDFKGAVDAIYYLGGGWPSENSKGRMEAALDKVAGMYKVLTLVGRGKLVEDHLANLGITISLQQPIQDVPLSEQDVELLNKEFGMRQFGFTPKTLSELVNLCIDEAMELQRFICQNADEIKHNLKPTAKAELGVEDEEYDRLFYLTKFAPKEERVRKKKTAIEGSVSKFRQAAKGV